MIQQFHSYLSKENKNTNLKRCMHPYVHCSIIYSSQDMEATQVSINRWMHKEDTTYKYNGILLSHKKNEILPFVTTWMNLEDIMLSAISQAERDKYDMISLNCGIWKKKRTNKTETDS